MRDAPAELVALVGRTAALPVDEDGALQPRQETEEGPVGNLGLGDETAANERAQD